MLYLLSYAVLILAGGYIWTTDRRRETARHARAVAALVAKHERDLDDQRRIAEARQEQSATLLCSALLDAKQQRERAEHWQGEAVWQGIEVVLVQSELDMIRDRFALLPTLDGVRAASAEDPDNVVPLRKGGA